MTAVECLKCEEFDKEECWCDFYEDKVNEDYKGYCRCSEYWGKGLKEMSKEELSDIIIDLLCINQEQNDIIDDLKDSCIKSDKSREFWVKKYHDLMDEIIKNDIDLQVIS